MPTGILARARGIDLARCARAPAGRSAVHDARRSRRYPRAWMTRHWWLGLLALTGLGLACGAEPNGPPLELLDFRQQDLDSVGLNEELIFYFSDDLEPGSVTSESVRIETDPPGRVVSGKHVVRRNALSFLPDLP